MERGIYRRGWLTGEIELLEDTSARRCPMAVSERAGKRILGVSSTPSGDFMDTIS